MRRLIYIIIMVTSGLLYSVAWAQCGYGVDAGGGNCVPGPGISGSPFNHYDDSNSASPPAPRAVWADRWGAIAADETTGHFASAEGQASKRQAEAEAMLRCTRRGNQHCQVELTYYNQCAAFAWGSGTGQFSSAANKDLAEHNAISRCESTSGANCKIIYSACSYAERVQ